MSAEDWRFDIGFVNILPIDKFSILLIEPPNAIRRGGGSRVGGPSFPSFFSTCFFLPSTILDVMSPKTVTTTRVS